MNRRELFAATAATGAVGVIPGAVRAAATDLASGGEPQSPAMSAYREWKAHYDYIKGFEGRGVTDEEFDRLTDRNHELQVRLFEIPSTGPLDTLAKLTAYTFNGKEFSDDGGLWSAALLAEVASAVSAAQ